MLRTTRKGIRGENALSDRRDWTASNYAVVAWLIGFGLVSNYHIWRSLLTDGVGIVFSLWGMAVVVFKGMIWPISLVLYFMN